MIDKFPRISSYLHFSKASFLAFSVISIIAVPVSYRGIPGQVIDPNTIFVGLISTTLIYPPYLLVIKVLSRHPRLDSLIIKLAALASLGLIRGISIFFGAQVLSIPQPIPLSARLLNSAMTTTVWLGLLSLLFELNDRYKRQYLALSHQLLISDMTAEDERERSFASITDEISRLQSSLRRAYMRAAASPHLYVAAGLTSDEILKEIETGLKPITRELWTRSLNSVPGFKFWHLMKLAVVDFRTDRLLHVPLYFLTSTINYSAAFQFVPGVQISLLGASILLISEIARRSVLSGVRESTPWINVGYLSLIGFSTVYFPFLIVLNMDFAEMLPYLFILGIFLTLILIALSILHHALTARSLILRNLTDELSRKERVDRVTLHQSSPSDFQLASYLHNSLQSELTAIAYELGKVADDPSEWRFRAAMARLSDVIERSLESDFIEYLESPADRYEKIIESWGSIVRLTLDVDEAVFGDSTRVSLFVQLVQESLANAVRGGRASAVSITARYEGGVLRVVISDDGCRRSGDKVGIGTTWISRLSLSRWNLDSSETGSKLIVDF